MRQTRSRASTVFGVAGWLACASAVSGCHSSANDSQSAGSVSPSASTNSDEAKRAMLKNLFDLKPNQERDMGDGTFMTLVRTKATDPIDGGWQRATSTGGGFSVEVPLAFNEAWTRAQSSDKVELRSYTVGTKTAGDLSWSATCIFRKDGRNGPPIPGQSTSANAKPAASGSASATVTVPVGAKAAASSIPSATASSGVASADASSAHRAPGKVVEPGKIEAMGDPARAYQQTVVFDDARCFLIVEKQGDDPLPEEADRSRFFHSLKRFAVPTF